MTVIRFAIRSSRRRSTRNVWLVVSVPMLLSLALAKSTFPQSQSFARSASVDGISFLATQIDRPDYIQVRVHATNIGTKTRSIGLDLCSVRLVVYSEKPSRRSRPVWEQPHQTSGCEIIRLKVGVRKTTIFGPDLIVGRHGADLAPGYYYMVVRFRIQGVAAELLLLASDDPIMLGGS